MGQPGNAQTRWGKEGRDGGFLEPPVTRATLNDTWRVSAAPFVPTSWSGMESGGLLSSVHYSYLRKKIMGPREALGWEGRLRETPRVVPDARPSAQSRRPPRRPGPPPAPSPRGGADKVAWAAGQAPGSLTPCSPRAPRGLSLALFFLTFQGSLGHRLTPLCLRDQSEVSGSHPGAASQMSH